MTPIDMTVKHDPTYGTYGDCFRCCVASVLDLPAADVPHFYEYCGETGDDGSFGWNKLTSFLRARGLYPIELTIQSDRFNEWVDHLRGNYILSGLGGRGFLHSVVAMGRGALVHDPHLTDKSGVRPDKDNNYSVLLFVKLL